MRSGAAFASIELRSEGEPFRGFLGAVCPRKEGASEKERHPAAEQSRLPVAIHGNIHQGSTLFVDAFRPVSAQNRALYPDRRVRVDVPLNVVRDVPRQSSTESDLSDIHRDRRHGAGCYHPSECFRRPSAKGLASHPVAGHAFSPSPAWSWPTSTVSSEHWARAGWAWWSPRRTWGWTSTWPSSSCTPRPCEAKTRSNGSCVRRGSLQRSEAST